MAQSVDRGQERPLIGRVDASVVSCEFAAVAAIHEAREHVGAEIPVREPRATIHRRSRPA